MISNFVDGADKKLDARIDKYKEDLAGGTCADIGAYKKTCGHIAVLREAKVMLKELKTRYENDDDDLEELNGE